MDARKGNIYEILNGNKQFLIPVYQRYYSWDIEQCKRLWNDIVEMQKKGKVGHFVGSIVNMIIRYQYTIYGHCQLKTPPCFAEIVMGINLVCGHQIFMMIRI